jgi:hypothetical protein
MTKESSSYSASVDMFLLLDNQKLPLGQLGPAHCILEQTASSPPGDGEIVLIIDGHESHIPVYLPDGITSNQLRVPYQSLVPTNDSRRP